VFVVFFPRRHDIGDREEFFVYPTVFLVNAKMPRDDGNGTDRKNVTSKRSKWRPDDERQSVALVK